MKALSKRRENMNQAQKYVKERDEMLLKRDPEELRKFVQSHKDYFPVRYVLAIASAPKQILEITLHKMIFNVKSLPKEMRNESAGWLIERGYNGDIGGVV
jgi:hypothetical protein